MSIEWKLWAKTGPEGTWHPLLLHMLDVAAVARRLVDDHFARGQLARFSQRLGVTELAFARWTVLLAALHDLGKASPPFQKKAPHLLALLREQRLLDPDIADVPHGIVTALELPRLLIDRGWPRQLARAAARWVGGHHGVFPTDREYRHQGVRRVMGGEDWLRARNDIFGALRSILGGSQLLPPLETEDPLADVGLFIAGLTSVADWIGSMSDFFPFHAGPVDLSSYFEDSLVRADRALGEIRWGHWKAGEQRTFQNLFGFPARPLQNAVIELTKQTRSPLLAIIEAPMGEGKTEAALWLAHALARQAGHGGLYLALPTMATANQMFRRVRDFLGESYAGRLNLQLLHGGADLVEPFHRLKGIADESNQSKHLDDACERGKVVAEGWFTRKKRGLLAPFAVGTVDQALLGVLRTRHGFVRMYGLAGKTVILDEVHAYDAYTSRLLERLVAWLARLGSSVVLLSATLPRSRREELLRQWQIDSVPETVPYPRLTSVLDGFPSAVPIPRGSSRIVHVSWHTGTIAEIARWLTDRVANGGCVGWICNTVGRAQDAWRTLQAHVLATGIEVQLIHARFPAGVRQTREEHLLESLGKDSSNRPQAAIVIGTQVLEQSLDIDFDLLVTDLAPVDLVLQRVGRLWRHERTRPESFQMPEVVIVAPLDATGSYVPHENVYDLSILLKSRVALQEKRRLDLPGDIESLVEKVYECSDWSAAEPEMATRIREAEAKREEEISAEERSAENRLLAPPSSNSDDPFAHFGNPLDEDDPKVAQALRALTRLGEISVTVICLHARDDGLFLRGEDEPVDLNFAIDAAAARRLLRHSVSISKQGLTHELLTMPVPKRWRDSPWLRDVRPLQFNNGTCLVAHVRIRDDEQLGIVFEKEGA